MGLSLILASGSPRRRELLARAGFDFESISPHVQEKLPGNLTLLELTLWNAIQKGMSVARIRPKEVVLAADTLVALDEEIIGKPNDFADATRILRRLSGRAHYVCSGVFICHLAGGRSISFHEISRVHFRPLSKAKIDNYLVQVEPLDKAGAYAAQGCGPEIIQKIEGSYTNVVGLPMEHIVSVLHQFGIVPRLR